MKLIVALLLCAISWGTFSQHALGALLYASSSLGAVGVARSQLGAVRGVYVADVVFQGVRFHVGTQSITTGIGGHFLSTTDESASFFGALVRLDGPNDFPDSGDLSTSDVLGHALMTFPEPSADIVVDISATLDVGWYAVVFGSGLFGATGEGGAIANGVDLGSPSYIAWQPDATPTGWYQPSDLAGDYFNNLRFVVEGRLVPEPNASCLAAAAVAGRLILCRRRS